MAKRTKKNSSVQVSLRGPLPVRTELAAAGMSEESIRAVGAVRMIAAVCGDLETRLTTEEISRQTGLKVWEIRAIQQGPEFTRLFEEALSERSAMLLGQGLSRMEKILKEGEDKDAIAAFRAVNACYKDVTEVAKTQDSETANLQMVTIIDRMRRANVSRIETVNESNHEQSPDRAAASNH